MWILKTIDKRWEDMKFFIKNTKFCDYFEHNLLPSFKSNAAIWTPKAAGIRNSHNGITNNASESMNAILRRLPRWKFVPVDVITMSSYQLCSFYHQEIQRSIHQCGSWTVSDVYHHLQRQPSLLPNMDEVADPKDIVDIISNGQTQCNCQTSPVNLQLNDSHIAMAHCAIANNRVKLSEDGAWVVRG